MSNRKFAIQILAEKGEITIVCAGNSMRPLIFSKEPIYLRKVDSNLLRVGDAVFCKVKSNLFVHQIGAIDKNRFKIQNYSGFVNGWIGPNSIFGLAMRAGDRTIVSEEELIARAATNKENIETLKRIGLLTKDGKAKTQKWNQISRTPNLEDMKK